MKNTLTITTPSDREIVMTREFNAPRRLVWEAMTKPELIRKWLFLPPGWEMTDCREDLHVGGHYLWAWNGPDGKPGMSISGVYREVVPQQRAVRTETMTMHTPCSTGAPPPAPEPGAPAGEVYSSIVLTERDGRTVLTLTVHCPNKQVRDAMLASGMETGVTIGYDNMERMLASGELGSA